MSKLKNKQEASEKKLPAVSKDPNVAKIVELPTKVKMIFTENKFYNDLKNPIFEANKVYELEGADWIQRWLKRGGAIVDENTGDAIPMDGDKEEKVEETNSEEVKEEAETA